MTGTTPTADRAAWRIGQRVSRRRGQELGTITEINGCASDFAAPVEHGRAPEPNVCWWQDRLTPVWKRIGGGCHLNRAIQTLTSLSPPVTGRIAVVHPVAFQSRFSRKSLTGSVRKVGRRYSASSTRGGAGRWHAPGSRTMTPLSTLPGRSVAIPTPARTAAWIAIRLALSNAARHRRPNRLSACTVRTRHSHGWRNSTNGPVHVLKDRARKRPRLASGCAACAAPVRRAKNRTAQCRACPLGKHPALH
jgi:hypothetical protein